MNVVLYENGTHDAGKKLQNMIRELIPKDCFETFPTIGNLTLQLRKPMNRISIALFLATTRDELRELIKLGDLLDSIQVILVLPDRNTDTLSLGLQLKTSYISDMDGNLSDVASVLKQILKKQRSNNYLEEENKK